MSIITTKESRVFDWSNPGTLKVGDEIAETLKDGRKVVFVVMDDGVIGLKGLLLDCQRMNDDWKKRSAGLPAICGTTSTRKSSSCCLITCSPQSSLASSGTKKISFLAFLRSRVVW